MAEINWGLGIMPDVGMNAFRAFKAGQEEGRARRAENALAAYVQNPNDQTVNDLAQHDPRTALQAREQMMDQQAAAREQAQSQLPVMGRLLAYAKQGPQQWQQALAKAQELGIDVSAVPGEFNPQWADQQISLVQAIGSPEGQQALSAAGKQAMDLGYKPGTPEFQQVTQQILEAGFARPYMGSQGETRLYTPQIGGGGRMMGGGPQPGTIEEGYRFKGGNPADPNSWEPVQGGPTQPASGNFPQ